jgi:predicted ribosomally synthesized peptide with nif11-like leader
MAVSDAHEYLHRLLTDEQFLGHVAAQPQDKRMAIARDAGLSFSDEELATAKREVLSMTVGQMLQEGMRHETARAALAAGAEVIATSFYFDTGWPPREFERADLS